MPAKQWLVSLVLLLGLPWSAPADGMFFPPVAIRPVEIPDQQALISFSDGVETLVIDTAFRGDGGEFAWVVPLPAKPEISPATPGLFTTLQILFAPKVVAHVSDLHIVILVLGVGLLASILAIRGGTRITSVVIVWLAMFALGWFLLGVLANAGSSGVIEAGGVSVLERKTVGVFDTVTLASARGEAVLAWLQSNGFQTPPEVLPVLAAYASNGWVFVASRLSTTASTNEVRRAHPLCFKFPTPRPVYPLRLTGVRNPPLKVDLYVFGQARAAAKGFAVEVCARTVAKAPALPLRLASVLRREVPVVHPALLKLVGGAAVATKLSATLSPAQMAEDAWIEWKPFHPTWKTYYTEEVARKSALNKGTALLMTGWVLCFGIACAQRKIPYRLLLVSALVVPALALLVGLTEWRTTPRATGARVYRGGEWYSHWRNAPILLEAMAQQAQTQVAGETDSLAALRGLLAEEMASYGKNAYGTTNPYTGRLPQEEDSPGNYTVRSNATGLEVLWYDQAGAEHRFPLTAPTGPPTNAPAIRR